MRLVELEGDEALPVVDGVSLPDPGAVRLLRPDRRFAGVVGGRAKACCSVWLGRLPAIDGHPPAAIGQFDCGDPETGARILSEVCLRLAELGADRAVGPIDADTWHRYRLVTDRGTRPPFFLEPAHPDFHVAAWRDAGFLPLAEFISTEMKPQTGPDPRLARVERRLSGAGVRIRNLDIDDYAGDLRRIHAVSTTSFADNLLYTPISEDAFLSLYLPLKERVRPGFVWLAEQRGECVGFLFGIPDLNQAARGAPVDTLVAKTLAVLPRRELAGLGNHLVRIAHRAAADAGYGSVVHALMHPASRIKHFGGGAAPVIRRYTLFQRTLPPS